MKPRIFGLEFEYGALSETLEPLDSDVFNHIYRNRFLPNGSRVYAEIGDHPEYCTPECSNPRDAVLYDKAGEFLMRKMGCGLKLYKNNIDSRGFSFGCHENYSIDPSIFTMKELVFLIPFLTTRQIFAGSGSVLSGEYRISQRAHSTTCEFDVGTTYDRPLINLRDEPLADSQKYKRLHLICGDANMSEIATYLKMGTTALVLDLLEEGVIPKIEFPNPIKKIRKISKNPLYRWDVWTGGMLKTRYEGRVSAVDVQRRYFEAAKRYRGSDEMTDDILRRWEHVLDQLEIDHMNLANWIDWVAKKALMQCVMNDAVVGWKDQRIRDIDVQYHDVDPNVGYFYFLQNRELMERLVTDEEVLHAVNNPPEDTRAFFRGRFVSKFEGAIRKNKAYVYWDCVELGPENDRRKILLPNPFDTYPSLYRELQL